MPIKLREGFEGLRASLRQAWSTPFAELTGGHMRYRTKSTEVRAVRWTGTDISKEAILAWLGPVGRTGKVNTIVVLTPIGDAYAHVGDWIIQEEEFFFVMKNDIFQGKYEPVLEVVRSEA